MRLTENLLEDYIKKIFGFAYEKCQNPYDAEELAQDIMVQLLECISKKTEVEHLSSFVYTVCCYTWSKYLRKNKKHWNCVDINEISEVSSEADVEAEATDKLLYAKVRRKISNLAKTHREIVVMHYYENKTTGEIAKLLNMNDNTVRWYLSNIRDTLKEKINMSDNLDFRPVSLCTGIDGSYEEPGLLRELEGNLLVQNIALACYEQPVTITEISEKLNVAAAYLEKYIEEMVYMDYLKLQGKKYQTNFFISDKDIELAKITYGYSYAKPFADKLYDAVMARKTDLLNIDYYGKNNVNEDYYLWYVLLKVAQEMSYEQMQREWDRCQLERPLRKDGSEYWIIANKRFDECTKDEVLNRYGKYRMCCGYKISSKEDLGAMYQADTYLCSELECNYRHTCDSQNMIKLLQTAKAIMRVDGSADGEMNDFEKMYVSEFIKDGYISAKDGKTYLKIPVFTVAQWDELNNIVKEIKNSLGEEFLKNYLDGYSQMMDKYIPKYLDKNVRIYHKYAMMGGFDLFAHMIMEAKEGSKIKLQIPTGEDAKYAMTWLVVK